MCRAGCRWSVTGSVALPLLVLLGVGSQPRRSLAQTGAVRNVHDPCVAEDNGAFYVFSTGRGIPIRESDDLFGWSHVGRVFKELPPWTKERVPGVKSLWAPDISYFNGKWHLYYSVSTYGSNRSCIGLATSPTLDVASSKHGWVDQGVVIASTPGRDNFNAIDPNVVLDKKRRPWLAFGSFWSGIMLCRLDRLTGKVAPGSKPFLIAGRNGGAIEAPFIYRKGRLFYLFVSFDHCCRGVRSTYKIMVGRSKTVAGPYLDRNNRPMIKGGGTLVLAGAGRFIGPGHNAVLRSGRSDWLVYHFYDRDENGVPTLQIRKLRWLDGWPVAGEPIGDPGKPR